MRMMTGSVFTLVAGLGFLLGGLSPVVAQDGGHWQPAAGGHGEAAPKIAPSPAPPKSPEGDGAARAPGAGGDDAGRPGGGDGAAETESRRSVLSTLTADAMEYFMEERRATFTGNVYIEDDRLQLKADRMEVRFNDRNEVRHADATGNVAIVHDTYRAVGGKAAYDLEKGRLVLTERPVLYREKHSLSGAERVVYDRAVGKAYTEGGRVQMNILVEGEADSRFEFFEKRKAGK